MRIRTKLAIALAIPLVALIVVTTMLVGKYSDDADDAGERSAVISNQVELATASLGPTGIIGALASERNTEALDVIGQLAAAGSTVPLTTAERERQQNAWWYLLVIAFLLLTAETVMSNRYYRAATPLKG